MGLSSAVIFIVLSIGTMRSHAAHFRGGTFHWKPTGNENEVEVTYEMAFNGFNDVTDPALITPDHETCKGRGEVQFTPGYLECTGCDWTGRWSRINGKGRRVLNWQCMDFSEDANWDVGGYSFTVNVVDSKASIDYNKCCWLAGIVNGPQSYVDNKEGYKMITVIDLKRRTDNNEINRSPVTTPIPDLLFQEECSYHLEIPVTDPDNDIYRCRYTEAAKDECFNPFHSDVHGNICGELGSVTVNDDCTLEFNPKQGAGYYAVTVAIEDFMTETDTQPLSQISLSFILEVKAAPGGCEAPVIVSPISECNTLPVGETYKITVVAEASTESRRVEDIITTKPPGMIATEIQDDENDPLRRSVDLFWTPTSEQIGRHYVVFYAVDEEGFTSGWSSMELNVDEVEPLYPLKDESKPGDGKKIKLPKPFEIRFNKRITRPSKSAYITLLDTAGNVEDQLDASVEHQVTFHNTKVTFSVALKTNFTEKKLFILRLDEGVAVDEGHGDCLKTRPDQWAVVIDSGKPAYRATTPPPPVVPPIYECTPGTVDISPPPGTNEGEECFIHLVDSTFTVTQNTVSVSYKLCCPSSCKMDT